MPIKYMEKLNFVTCAVQLLWTVTVSVTEFQTVRNERITFTGFLENSVCLLGNVVIVQVSPRVIEFAAVNHEF